MRMVIIGWKVGGVEASQHDGWKGSIETAFDSIDISELSVDCVF